MLHAGKRKRGIALDRWLLRRPRSRAKLVDKHDASQSAKTAGVRAERNRRYDVLFVASKVTSNGTATNATRARREKTFMAKGRGHAPEQQQRQQSPSGPTQHAQSNATGTAAASATFTARAREYKTASKSVVTGTEPAAHTASTQKDDNYVYIQVPRKKVAPVKTGRTETVHHNVSQSAGPQNAAPVLQSVSVKLPAPASQLCL